MADEKVINELTNRIEDLSNQISLLYKIRGEKESELMDELTPFYSGEKIINIKTHEVLIFDSPASVWGHRKPFIYDFFARKIKKNGSPFKIPNRFYDIRKFKSLEE